MPSFFTAQSADNFNRQRMLSYLGLPAGTEKVNTLNGKFDVDRFFCLIGTNPKDYTVASGWSARLVGPFSDGLVRTDNATVFDGDELPERQNLGRAHMSIAATRDITESSIPKRAIKT